MNGAQSVHPAFKLYRIQEHPSYTDASLHITNRAALKTQSEPTQYLYNIQHDNIGGGKMAGTEHLEFPLSSVGMSKRILLR